MIIYMQCGTKLNPETIPVVATAELASDGDRIVADADEAPAGTLQPTRSGSSSSSSSGSRFRELSPADLI